MVITGKIFTKINKFLSVELFNDKGNRAKVRDAKLRALSGIPVKGADMAASCRKERFLFGKKDGWTMIRQEGR